MRAGVWYDNNKRDIGEALLALGAQPAIEDVNRVIGNNSWTQLICDECKNDVAAVVQLGAEPDYESATACVCGACLLKARRLLRG